MDFKHFIKTVIIFSVMIGLGLLGVYLLDNYDKSSTPAKVPSSSVAK